MDINGTQRFNASPQQVWDALHNSAMLQSCAPGGATIAWANSNLVVTGTAPVINRTGTITIQVSDERAPSHLRLNVARGNVNATADINLAPDGAGTNLTYTVHADLGGAFAAAAMMVKPMAESQVKQLFSCLASKVG
jgi:carbon monoxide dehydrogenase subunit G